MSQMPSFAEWGVAIAVCAWLIKEGLSFFKTKDQTESEHFKELIFDLRQRANKADSIWLPALRAVHAKQDRILSGLEVVESRQLELATRHNSEMISTMKQSALALAEVREQLAIIKELIRAVHDRMDSERPPRRLPDSSD